MELVCGLVVIVNGGYDVQFYFIEWIQDVNGEIIYEVLEIVFCDQQCEQKVVDEDIDVDVVLIVEELFFFVDISYKCEKCVMF